MATLWILLIFGLLHVVVSEEGADAKSAAVISGTGSLDDLLIAELGDLPALSVPGSSEEVSNEPKLSTKLFKLSTSSRVEQSTSKTSPPVRQSTSSRAEQSTSTSTEQSTSSSSSSTSSTSSTSSSSSTIRPDAVPKQPIASVPASGQPPNVPAGGGSVPSVPVPDLVVSGAPVSRPAPGSALKVSIGASSASAAANAPPLDLSEAVALSPTHASGDINLTRQAPEKVPIIEEPNVPSRAPSVPTLETVTTKGQNATVNQTTKQPLVDILSGQQRPNAVNPPVQETNKTEVSVNVTSKGTAAPVAGGPISASATPLSEAEQKSIPSIVKNPRVTIIGYTGKPVHTFNLTEKQILYQVRVFWLEPENWRDRGFRPPNRLYDLFCWLSNDGTWVHDLLRQNFSAAIFSHSQWYAFPEVEKDAKANLTVDCGVRAINSGNKASDWNFSAPAEILDSPIFLRGFDNVNVKGWTPEEVTHLIKNGNTESRRDAPESAAKNVKAGPVVARRC